MAKAIVALASLLAAASAAAQAGDADDRVRVRIEAPAECFVGEVVFVTVVIEVDGTWFDEHAVSLFRRELGLPVAVSAPFLAEMPGGELLADRATAGSAQRIGMVVEGSEVTATVAAPREAGGRQWRVYECRRRARFGEAGAVALAGAAVKFAWASEFIDDIVQGRTPRDRQIETVAAAAVQLMVLELPPKVALGRLQVPSASWRWRPAPVQSGCAPATV